MDWNVHMIENVQNWLLPKGDTVLDEHFLMLFGNPYLFQRERFFAHFYSVEPVGVFYRCRVRDISICCCPSLFGGPMTAMYLEVLARCGVKDIIACGYVGGLSEEALIGSYVLPTIAHAYDGTTRNYAPYTHTFPAAPSLLEALHIAINGRPIKCTSTPIAIIDALLLEDDDLIATFNEQGIGCIDLETACLYALAKRYGIRAASI